MALHAVDDLSDAYRATRSFLLPVEWGRWLRLALLSLFVAGSSGGGAPTSGFQGPLSSSPEPTPGDGTELGPALDHLTATLSDNLVFILGIITIGFLVVLALQWLAATFEFTFLESLRTDAVHVRDYTSANTGPGTRLFAFRVLFGLATLLVFGGLLLLVLGPILTGVSPAGPLLLLVFLIPVFIVLGIVASIVYVLTTAFVAPIMLLEDRGLLSAWKRFWGVFKSAWTDFLVYLLVGLFLMIAIGIIVGIVMAVIGVAIALPVIVVLLALGPLWAAVVAIPAALLAIVAWALVQVPVQTYLRHWSLLVLGDVEPELDLIPDRRAEIRGETTS
ncbi:DUF7544 domain-containing protein [Halodesulfurarchaeum sp.]|uniref:DUF7544 domain-containing protein n=1 Tax=Halodesulfurarchaeum sp. TaxID=1980530 RepID=UPI001BC67C4B|nr:hypothetical protein [Halodesulfurarchaeum sp.]